ncbi:MAG: 2-amino-4-hydroxy-6-hydroxymethyldihydropteridine diphosphokinase [Gammaproteobacteria bacterium]|uniref:2-amino-4-hydroxy-6- hydroxymethyldihydropteridine diphosphokinase n=1 Tax=Pseudomaricurvus alcaniphilus TaxID=1166482 RepID=UPI00140E5EF9|nr:2-amino-4-hydroxy-6-hydroxymethyldihydropteridine diphosphokinase [Pseudomaricurvus alcaniphilus]MBR9909527.1 2-amino-4-hydroxy-6-hydroxymethyldihydropteridine diphosphokinase [Gammaproteobacteria bacterium]NHN37059.1 2-amino-4-hydroxy-6-hydroxymethyldihydropteridine diphosphokinase [Pseudomaricurvus alcaniphilus]
MSTTPAYIALGSNLDNPWAQVNQALAALAAIPHSRLLAQSCWYRSEAMGPVEQPDFINGVALLETGLQPHALLDQLQAIEASQKRVRDVHWGPRTLDLDLLLYGDQVISSERLQVPHPGLGQRNFVLYPLADISPQLTLPSGESLASLLRQCGASGLTRINHSSGVERE